MLVYVDESCVGFTNRNRCNCGARILKKWNVNYFVLVRYFFCSRTKIKKFYNRQNETGQELKRNGIFRWFLESKRNGIK